MTRTDTLTETIRAPRSTLRPAFVPTRGVLYALAATGLFSFKSIIVRHAVTTGVPADMLLMIRLAVAAPLLCLVWMFRPIFPVAGTSRRDFAAATLCGVLLAAAMATSFESIARIPAAIANGVTFTYPVLTVALLALVRQQRPGILTITGLCVATTGVALVGGLRPGIATESIAGLALALLSAAMFALYNVGIEPVAPRLGATAIAALTTSAAGAVLLLTRSFALPTDPAAWGWGILLGTACGVLPFLLYNAAIARIGAIRLVAINLLGPPLTALWALFLLGEAMTPWQWTGLAAIVAGVFAGSRQRRAQAG